MIKRFRQKTNILLFTIVLVAIAAIVCILSYHFIDIPLARYFQTISWGLKESAQFVSELLEPRTNDFFWPLAFVVFKWLFPNQIRANRCLLLLLSMPLTAMVIDIVKTILGRARPALLFSQDLYGFTFFSTANVFHSFPSGHGGTTGVLCGALCCFYPNAKALWIILALFINLNRVVLTQHYLSDVIAGFAIGFAVSQCVYSLMKSKFLFHKEARR